MAVLVGAMRLGKNAEVRYLPDSTPVTNLSLAYNFGKKNPAEGNRRPTQWIDATLWGERGPKLQEWLVQGATLDMVLEDVHIETYSAHDGTPKFKLSARVVNLDIVSTPQGSNRPAGGSAQAPAPAAAPRQAKPPTPRPASGFDDMDDIPF